MTTTSTVPDRLGNDIIRISSSEWFVRSRRHAPGAFWLVQTCRGDEPVCGCPAGRDVYPGTANRSSRACHHLRCAVDFEIKRDRMVHPPREAMPANIGSLVD